MRNYFAIGLWGFFFMGLSACSEERLFEEDNSIQQEAVSTSTTVSVEEAKNIAAQIRGLMTPLKSRANADKLSVVHSKRDFRLHKGIRNV